MLYHSRKLTDHQDKNSYNAWDEQEISDGLLQDAEEKLLEDTKFIEQNKSRLEKINSQESWEIFYSLHSEFFRNRKWIIQGFEGILDGKKILEMGCGVGNSLHWFAQINKEYMETCSNPKDCIDTNRKKFDLDEFFHRNVFNIKIPMKDISILPYELHGCDFSHHAIRMCQKKYYGLFFVHDIISSEPIIVKFDTILLVFSLSAINPKYHASVLEKAFTCLNPGGKLFFKDFGRLDMVQLRYKPTNILAQNLYQRSDGTLAYFFDENYFKTIIGRFRIIELKMEKRLLINRKRKLDMYRVFLQAILEKPIDF